MVLNFLLSSNFKEIQNLFGPLGHNSSAPPHAETVMQEFCQMAEGKQSEFSVI